MGIKSLTEGKPDVRIGNNLCGCGGIGRHVGSGCCYLIEGCYELTVDSGKWTVMEQTVEQKSFLFAVRIVKLSKHLNANKKEYVLSKQLLRSGTSIGANIAEAEQAQSRADFISKMNIALKEAVETNYWLRLLRATDYLSETEFTSIHGDCREVEKMLTAIVKTAKQ